MYQWPHRCVRWLTVEKPPDDAMTQCRDTFNAPVIYSIDSSNDLKGCRSFKLNRIEVVWIFGRPQQVTLELIAGMHCKTQTHLGDTWERDMSQRFWIQGTRWYTKFHRTLAGSQQYLCPSSSWSSACIWSLLRLQSSSLLGLASAIWSFLRDLGMTAHPFCNPHLSSTCIIMH